jgi:hypothetical protein
LDTRDRRAAAGEASAAKTGTLSQVSRGLIRPQLGRFALQNRACSFAALRQPRQDGRA